MCPEKKCGAVAGDQQHGKEGKEIPVRYRESNFTLISN